VSTEIASQGSFIVRYRVALYIVANLLFIMLIGYGAAVSDASVGRPLYLIALFALCFAPVLFLTALNDRYALLGIFMAMYFVNFGMADALALLTGGVASTNADLLSPAECGILIGAVLALTGYLLAAKRAPRVRDSITVADWSQLTTLLLGLGLTCAGIIAYAYFHFVAVTVNSNQATTSAFVAMGPALTFIVMLGHLVLPLGLLILAYGYARFRTFRWFVLVMVMLLSQVILGFVGDTKGLPLQAGMLVILARTLMDNRLPRAWLIGGAVAVALMFPVFQAYRAEVVGVRGLNRAQAAQDIGKVLDIALAAEDKVNAGKPGQRAQTIFERASTKSNVELVFDRVGIEAPFQHGRTLMDLALAFIPRLLWPDKPGVATGQVFNKEVVRGDGDTFISPSHLGELYWNFGWPGLIGGMLLVGALLGAVGARSSLAEGVSATRLLILLATVNGLCLGFEGSIAISYVVWLRSIAAVGLLHLLFARRQASAGSPAEPLSPVIAAPATRVPAAGVPTIGVPAIGVSAAAQLADAPLLPRFPNILR
jgi:hypothetical protein